MTIVVTPTPLAAPPVNQVAVSVPVGSIMLSARVWRNDPDGTRTDLREQPTSGFNSRTVEDPECPYEQSVTYGWAATYVDPTTFPTVWDETWVSTAAWTPISGSFNVSAGKVRNNAAGAGTIYRTLTSGRYRVTISSMAEATATGRVRVRFGGSDSMILTVDSAGVLWIDTTPTTINPALPIVVDMGTTSWTVTGTGGSYSVPVTDTITLIRVTYELASAANELSVGEIKVQSYPVATSIEQTSSPVTLDVHDTWLVHPAAPGKSFKLQHLDPLRAGIRTFGDITRPSKANLIDVMGSDIPVPVTFGPRGGAQLSITIATVTSAERAALDAVLADEVPLLVNVPPSWEADFDVGFYAFLTSLERRHVAFLSVAQPARLFEIPIVKVGSPIVDVENSGWSVAAVLAEFATVAEVLGTFDTTADLLVNNRS